MKCYNIKSYLKTSYQLISHQIFNFLTIRRAGSLKEISSCVRAEVRGTMYCTADRPQTPLILVVEAGDCGQPSSPLLSRGVSLRSAVSALSAAPSSCALSYQCR